MMKLTTAVFCTLTLAAGGALATDAKKTDAAMAKPMTMQECKDHMGMAKKDGMKKDDAMMKKDTMCADMMKKDGAMMKKDGAMKNEPMKK